MVNVSKKTKITTFLVVLILALASVCSSCKKKTAVCNDGSPSYSTTRSGTCSHHGGVAYWCDK